MRFAICCAAASLFLAALLSFTPSLAQQAAPIAQVVGLDGDAALIGLRERRALTEGMPLREGDRIVTMGASRVAVRFEDGSMLVVGASSEIVVRHYGGENGNSTALSLVFGIVRATVPPGHRGGFEIWTNSAIAAVRYTEWIVLKQADRSAVFAERGEVTITARGTGRDFTLRAGQGIDILGDGEIRGPQEWGAARVDQVRNATQAP